MNMMTERGIEDRHCEYQMSIDTMVRLSIVSEGQGV